MRGYIALSAACALLAASCGPQSQQVRCPAGRQTPETQAPEPSPPPRASEPAPAPEEPRARDERRAYGTYGCRPARGAVDVAMKRGYTVEEVATWYFAMTCNAVVVPKYALFRRSERGVQTTVEAAEIGELLQSMLAELGLAAVTQGGLTAIFDDRNGVVEAAKLGEPRIVLVPGPWLPRGPSPSVADARPPDAETATEVDAGIRRLSETHYEVDAELCAKVFANPAVHAKARIVPSIKNGKANGFKLYAIRPSSVYAKIGLQNGDTVHAINGFPLTTPDQALDAYVRLKDADRYEIEITRRGKRILLVIDLK